MPNSLSRMCGRTLRTIAATGCLALAGAGAALGIERVVSTTAQFSAALNAAVPGDEIILQPGVYGGGHYRANLQQVTIRSANPANPAIIDAGGTGIQLSDPSHVTISDLVFRNQADNGLNIDDGGSFNSPAANITLRNITVRDIITAGNNDGIKLSGVNDFLIENVEVLNWGIGGSAVDMVGCHRGLIQNSHFRHTNPENGGTTVQTKGGSKDITFRANRIDLPRGAGRAVQAGGSTATQFFRFVDGDSGYEADEIVADGNVIIGGSAAFAWVNIDGGVFHHNVVSRPGHWVARILNENGGLPIVDTQNGVFQDNRIVFNDTPTELHTAVNVGVETLPNTYTFARNQWLNLANPTPAGSTPDLPVPETGGSYGVTPAPSTDVPQVWNFPWGKWIVNANTTPQTVDASAFQSLQKAIPGANALFNPLEADPLDGAWTSTSISTPTLQLPAFSQAILIDPAACPNCVALTGDYDSSGEVDQEDYNLWRATFGTTSAASDGNKNGVVDAADFTVWRNAFESQAAKGRGSNDALTLPEPTVSFLSALTLIAAVFSKSRRWHRRS